MAKKYISHQLIWLLVIIATPITGTSCDSCNRTAKTKPTSTTPIDNADSESSASSGYASDNSGSTSSVSSAPSNFSSGSTSSSRSSSSSPPPTDFAGLPNIGNTCYMNAALQIIAALYKDKVPSNSGLGKIVTQINNGDQPLTRSDIDEFVKSLPKNAKDMATSGGEQDPHEFILNLEKELNLDPIVCSNRLLFRTEERENNKQVFRLRQQTNSCNGCEHQLFVDIDKEGTTQRSLSEMIELSREELINNRPVVRRSDPCLCHQGSKSSFLEKNEKNLSFQNPESPNLKHYIQQQVIDKRKIPSVLYVQLKRFTTENTKIQTPVHGTFELTIKPDPNLNEIIHFDLHGFIVHEGSTNSGHYMAYIKRNGKWYQANDTSITSMNESEAISESKKGYLFFYKKK